MHGEHTTGGTTIDAIAPVLNVRNVSDSLDYYTRVLGFTVDWTWNEPADFASVSRDGHAIVFCRRTQGHPGTWISIRVGDIDPLFDEFADNGALFREGPTNYPSAFEMRIEDPDGHVLRFGSPNRPELPVEVPV